MNPVQQWLKATREPDTSKGMHYQLLSEKTGVHPNTLRNMAKTGSAQLETLVQCLEATGYELQIINKRTGLPVELDLLEAETRISSVM